LAYINPDLAEEHRQKGNAIYKEGKFPAALKEYEEACRRNPKDAKIYGNMALCYLKLMEPVMAIKKCEEALKHDPKFVKAYERMGKCHMLMKKFDKAMQAFEEGLKLDPENAVCQSGKREAQMKIMGFGQTEEDRAEQQRQALKDPEVQAIL